MEINEYIEKAEQSNELSKAIEIATKLHTGQLDKGGSPYILHPLRVMMKMNDNISRVVAVLHDVLEDTPFSVHDAEDSEFSEEIIEALKSISRKKDESYMDFIRRCKQNELARKVKIADIEDNMDLSRIPSPSEEDEKRNRKYKKALEELRISEYPRYEVNKELLSENYSIFDTSDERYLAEKLKQDDAKLIATSLNNYKK